MMMSIEDKIYRTYSSYMRKKYGQKVYKIPIKISGTCPNRDGTVGEGGCIYCSESGGSFENLNSDISIETQYDRISSLIEEKYKASKFIAYLQSFSNTYMDSIEFEKIMHRLTELNAVEIYLSTRSDCFNAEIISVLKRINRKKPVTVELGLQTSNEKSLMILNRGHDVYSFINSCVRLKEIGVRVCAHVIIDLPYDSMDDVLNTAHLINALCIDEVKIHSLYVVKNTKLEQMFQEGTFIPLSFDEYKERLIAFIRHLNPNIVLQRIIGRAPEESTVFCNWGKSWWLIRDTIINECLKNNYKQGDLYRDFDEILNKTCKNTVYDL